MASKLYDIYVPDPLNPQASVLVDVQTDIKITIKNGVLNGAPFFVIQNKVRDLIDKALKKLTSETLRNDARVSLMDFSNRLYTQMKIAFPDPIMAAAIFTLVKSVTNSIAEGKTSPTEEIYKLRTNVEKKAFRTLYGQSFETTAKGIPLQEFQKTYISKVSEALDNLAKERALDPNDVTGRNGLRNLAEMQVRYERHQDEIKSLKAQGVKLVICSTHGDCSERCSGWQGRVYSLDGTYGKTKDGRSYVPLEVATDVFYTTKAGRTYKNGLLGFNCRHKLYPYVDGMVTPTVSLAVQMRERAITRRQRELERNVLRWREEAIAQKGNALKYREARRNALKWNEEYKRYSKEHGRPYYPDRVKVL